MNIPTDPFTYPDWYDLDDFFIEPLEEIGPGLPAYVFESVVQNFLVPLNSASNELGSRIHISRNSCFRSVQHEKNKGRNGLSVHTFGTYSENSHDKEKEGAADLTIGEQKLFAELGIILARLPYLRICCYPNNLFYHVDFKTQNMYFAICESPTSTWQQVRFEQMVEAAEEVIND